MPKALSDEQTAKELKLLPKNWYIGGDGQLASNFELESFKEALKFIALVARTAEKLKHHPDITWSYRTVLISLITHEVGALSELDFKAAKSIEKCHQNTIKNK